MKQLFFNRRGVWWGTAVFLLITTACSGQSDSVATEERVASPNATAIETAVTEPDVAVKYDQYEIVTLLPRDGIPAIDDPQFYTTAEADEFYAPDELIIGVEFDGDARAYSVPFLSSHEIVNDTVGGREIAVTW